MNGATELVGDELSNRYFNLLAGFIDKFSLGYDLRRPCTLCPTLPGVFASLVRDLPAAWGGLCWQAPFGWALASAGWR